MSKSNTEPISPSEYDELLNYVRYEERIEYVRLVQQLAAKNITEEWFNSAHKEFFERLRKRKVECNDMMVFRLPPAYHSVMHSSQKKEYYETIVMYKTGSISAKEFASYHENVIAGLEGKVKAAKENDKIMKSLGKDDQVCMKLAGAKHSDYNDVKKTFGRYKTKYGNHDDRAASTFYEVN